MNGGLLIDAEYRGMLRRIEIQTDNVGRLKLELRTVLVPGDPGHLPYSANDLWTSNNCFVTTGSDP